MSGDVLLTGGYVISALRCYQSALTAISPGPRARDSSNDSSHAHGGGASETWVRLTFWLLKKSLLCLALASGANPTPASSPRLIAAQTLHTVLYDQLKAIVDSVRASRNGVIKDCNSSNDPMICYDDDIDVTWTVPGTAIAASVEDGDDDDSMMMMSFSATEEEDDCFEEKDEAEKIHPRTVSTARGVMDGINATPTATAPSSSGALANDDTSSLQLSCRFVRVLADHNHDHDHDQVLSRQHPCGGDERVEASLKPKIHTINAPSVGASCFRVIVQAEILHVKSSPAPISDAIPRGGGRIHDDQRTRAREKPLKDEHDCIGDEELIVVISCDAVCHVMRNGDDEAAVISSIDESGSNSSGGSSSRGDRSSLAVGERLLRAFQFSVQIPPPKERPSSNSGSSFSSSNPDKLKTERIEKALQRIEKALERDELTTKQSENSPVKSPIISPVKRNLLDDSVVREKESSIPSLLVDLSVR